MTSPILCPDLCEFYPFYGSMLSDFYSNDPERRGHLEGKGQPTRLSLLSTLPAVAFSCALLAPFVATSYGRQLYWKIWLFGSLAGIMWMKLTNWAPSVDLPRLSNALTWWIQSEPKNYSSGCVSGFVVQSFWVPRCDIVASTAKRHWQLCIKPFPVPAI